MNMKTLGIYIHIPFCKSKCFYCDFISYENKDNYINEYIEALKKEIKSNVYDQRKDIIDYVKNNKDNLSNKYIEIKEYEEEKEEKNVGSTILDMFNDNTIKNDLFNEKFESKEYIIDTIYIGGGTPSIVNSKYITEIIDTIKKTYNVSKNVEITIEVNPGTVDEIKLKEYYNAGCNRLSIGMQSSNNDILKSIGRIHTYEQFENTYKCARKVGFKNINIDVMLALPKQTLEDLEDTIKKVINLNPEHISVYSLILEEGTKLSDMVDNNKLKLIDEKLERKMYWKVKNILEKSGYNQYEISNFSKKGYESKHNMNCWNQEEYLGFGVAAHSYINGVRYSNITNIEEYIKNIKNEKYLENRIIHEVQNNSTKMNEYMLLGLRKINGINMQKFKQKFAQNVVFTYRIQLSKLVNENLLEIDDNDNIKLTNHGLDLANIVWEEFI